MATSAATLDRVQLAGFCAAGLDGAGVGPVKQGGRDGTLDHVAGDDHERDPLLGQVRDQCPECVLAGTLAAGHGLVLGHGGHRVDEVGLVAGHEDHARAVEA